ncbi:MFS transporter [Variovorax sp.]|uniref:MFS transporter n=1 Tax=Variovorax sp. TaxID=1871043 RepID=UPI00137C9275|nr:MFS transporter [Variovorax sp.]KAF1066493.1 MAG: Purine efflux pump PbuE [Variovorax sp.]
MHHDPAPSSTAPATPERLPLSLAWLALGAFAIGTESFIVAGLLPVLAADLRISPTHAGQLVLLFALSYAIGSPLMAAACARFGRRPLLVASLAAFSGLTLLASMAQGFGQLALARLALGLVAGVFVPTASAVAASLVSPALRGRALAIVTGGGTLAVALGVPLGAWIAGWGGWRTAYLLIAALGLVATLGLAAGLPRRLAVAAPAASGGAAFAVLRAPGVLAGLGVSVLWTTGGFSFYTYIALFLSHTVGIGPEGIGAVFVAIGVAAALGTAAGGWATDRFGADRVARGFALLLVAVPRRAVAGGPGAARRPGAAGRGGPGGAVGFRGLGLRAGAGGAADPAGARTRADDAVAQRLGDLPRDRGRLAVRWRGDRVVRRERRRLGERGLPARRRAAAGPWPPARRRRGRAGRGARGGLTAFSYFFDSNIGRFVARSRQSRPKPEQQSCQSGYNAGFVSILRRSLFSSLHRLADWHRGPLNPI